MLTSGIYKARCRVLLGSISYHCLFSLAGRSGTGQRKFCQASSLHGLSDSMRCLVPCPGSLIVLTYNMRHLEFRRPSITFPLLGLDLLFFVLISLRTSGSFKVGKNRNLIPHQNSSADIFQVLL